MKVLLISYKIFYLFLLPVLLISLSCQPEKTENLTKDTQLISETKKKYTSFDYTFEEKDSMIFADSLLIDSLRSVFPLITGKQLEKITDKKFTKTDIRIIRLDSLSADTSEVYNVSYEVPNNFLVDSTKLLWELNIPEFKSRIYQLYNGDTILLTSWNNVVGKVTEKTYTGHFEVYKIRNWPNWTNPDKNEYGEHDPPTPPGPGNPLGLFVVHYDKNSLRYFHGTNKPWLLRSKYRNVSKGCVRNSNKDIAIMKEFIIKRIIKSDDLSNWLGKDRRRSMIYNLKDTDKFPVRIIYKTFRIDYDSERGPYFEKFRDIYGYRKWNFSRDRSNNSTLIMLTTPDNIKKEFRKHFQINIDESKLDQIIDYLIEEGESYERYYFYDLVRKFNVTKNPLVSSNK